MVASVIHPFPLTNIEASLVENEDAFTAWFLVCLSFPFIAGAFGTFIVRERETKAKHLQTVAGVQPIAYWLSSYLWDCLNYILPCGIVIILMFAFDITVLITTDKDVVYGVLSLLVLFGPAAAGFTYIITFLFSSPAICFVAVVIGSFILGIGGSLTVFILVLVSSFREVGKHDFAADINPVQLTFSQIVVPFPLHQRSEVTRLTQNRI